MLEPIPVVLTISGMQRFRAGWTCSVCGLAWHRIFGYMPH
jgi:hypothetical protein